MSVIQLAIDKAASQAMFAPLSTEQRESIARFVSGNDASISLLLPSGVKKPIGFH